MLRRILLLTLLLLSIFITTTSAATTGVSKDSETGDLVIHGAIERSEVVSYKYNTYAYKTVPLYNAFVVPSYNAPGVEQTYTHYCVDCYDYLYDEDYWGDQSHKWEHPITMLSASMDGAPISGRIAKDYTTTSTERTASLDLLLCNGVFLSTQIQPVSLVTTQKQYHNYTKLVDISGKATAQLTYRCATDRNRRVQYSQTAMWGYLVTTSDKPQSTTAYDYTTTQIDPKYKSANLRIESATTKGTTISAPSYESVTIDGGTYSGRCAI